MDININTKHFKIKEEWGNNINKELMIQLIQFRKNNCITNIKLDPYKYDIVFYFKRIVNGLYDAKYISI